MSPGGPVSRTGAALLPMSGILEVSLECLGWDLASLAGQKFCVSQNYATFRNVTQVPAPSFFLPDLADSWNAFFVQMLSLWRRALQRPPASESSLISASSF